MTVKQLIEKLKEFDENMNVGIGNYEDDSVEGITELKESAIEKIERFDEYENRLTGEYFLVIGYHCSMCSELNE